MNKMFNFVVFVSLLSVVLAADPKSGCPDLKPIENFNLTGVSHGVWHEIARYPYAVETTISCVSYDTTPLEDGYVAESINTPRDSAAFARAECRIIPDEKASGLMKCIISSADPSRFIHLPLVQFLYEEDQYVVPYGCVYDEKSDTKQEFAWIFSRRQVPFAEVKEDVYNIIKSVGHLDVDKFIWIDHSSCNNV